MVVTVRKWRWKVDRLMPAMSANRSIRIGSA
jgi:hypothetical protein